MVTSEWPDTEAGRRRLDRPRHDIVHEQLIDAPVDPLADRVRYVFGQRHGPFSDYRRTAARDGGRWRETTEYSMVLPWFGWAFSYPIRATLRRRGRPATSSWWLPPDVLTSRQVLVLGLLAAASMSSAFVNTVFTQTVPFAAADFGIDNRGIGVAGSVVRAGIILSLPAAFLADRLGRRRIIAITAWLAPSITALGALAPTFTILVITQAIGRPMGLALAFLVAVVAAEEMPRTCRAYAISVMAMASGLGAGIAVMALPLADLAGNGWRLVFMVSLVWLVVAVDISRRLPETERFVHRTTDAAPLDRVRFVLLGVVAVSANLFVSPASFFQNVYLRDLRGYSAALIAIFTLVTATPAALGLILGGRMADERGRRRLIAVCIPISTVFLVAAFSVPGSPMWISAFIGGFLGSVAYPAMAVYRAELFPTGSRGKVAGVLSAVALLGGIIGLLAAGSLLDTGWGYGQVMGVLGLGQLITVVVIMLGYPETAKQSLEDLNPTDPVINPAPRSGSAEPH
jgi:MFS family permease